MINLEFNDKPHSYEIIIDEETATIYFSLHPELNAQIKPMLERLNFENENDWFCLAKFIFPNNDGWGFGKIFNRVDKHCDSGWICWECSLPYKPSAKKITEIALSISYLAIALLIIDTDNLPTSSHQYLELGYLSREINKANGGSFGFTYSREVLDYNKYWVENDPDREEEILNCMRKIYARLAGKKYSRGIKYDFNIGLYHAENRFPTFRVPGNCACIGPCEHSDARYPGARYSPHNIDTKLQQLSLLAGVIKLANMAREHNNKLIMTQ